MTKSELVSVQYLRGVAAALVVFYHALDQLPAAKALIPTEIGAMGVDLFFVISGVVMTYTTALHKYSPADFLARRTIRIVPLYWTTTTLVALLLIFAGDLTDTSRFTLDSYIQSLLFIPHENSGLPGAILPMLKLGWTLNYEVLFYLCFAALIGLSPLSRTLALTALFTLLIGIVAALSPDWVPLRFWANTIIFEFIFGCIIGMLLLNGALTKLPASAWLAILLAAITAMVALSFQLAPTFWRFLQWGLPAAAIVAAFAALEQHARAPWRSGALHFLGDASYSIYLTHAYVVVAFRVLWQKLALPAEGWGPVLLFVFFCVIVGIAAGCVTYFLLERPLTNAARSLFIRRRIAEA